MPGNWTYAYACYPAIAAISYLYTLKTRGLLTFSRYQLGDFAQNALFNGLVTLLTSTTAYWTTTVTLSHAPTVQRNTIMIKSDITTFFFHINRDLFMLLLLLLKYHDESSDRQLKYHTPSLKEVRSVQSQFTFLIASASWIRPLTINSTPTVGKG